MTRLCESKQIKKERRLDVIHKSQNNVSAMILKLLEHRCHYPQSGHGQRCYLQERIPLSKISSFKDFLVFHVFLHMLFYRMGTLQQSESYAMSPGLTKIRESQGNIWLSGCAAWVMQKAKQRA